MLSVTEDQKKIFKDICDKKFNGKVEFIIISLLNKRPDLMDNLVLNNVSFNYLIDNDNIIEVVPFGWQTNGSYRNVETQYSNSYIKCVNIGLVMDDIRNVDGAMTILKNKLAELYYTKKIRLVIGDTVHVNHTKDTKSSVYKKIPESYIVDVTFHYFRQLFR